MENNVYSTPESELVNDQKDDYELAGRGSRLIAAVVDTLIIIPFSGMLMYFTGWFELVASGEQPPMLYSLGIGLVNMLIFILINGHMLVNYGQTLGKRVLNIKIVTFDQEKAEKSHLLKRYAFYMGLAYIPVVGSILSLINVLFIFSSSKRCLHDLFAQTSVVKS